MPGPEKQRILGLLSTLATDIQDKRRRDEFGPVIVWESDTVRCLGCRNERPELDHDYQPTECEECGPYEEGVTGSEEWWGTYANKTAVWGPYTNKDDAEEDLS